MTLRRSTPPGEIRDTFLGATRSPVKSDDVRGTQFPSGDEDPHYDKTQVDAFLDAAGIRLAAMEATGSACRRTGQTDLG